MPTVSRRLRGWLLVGGGFAFFLSAVLLYLAFSFSPCPEPEWGQCDSVPWLGAVPLVGGIGDIILTAWGVTLLRRR
jgi:hypothetical protein